MTWSKTTYPGIRYRTHPTRKLRPGQPDRYYAMRYRLDGKSVEEALGWASEGWNPEKAHGVLSRLKENIRTGVGPRTLAELRAEAAAARRAEVEAEQAAALGGITLAELFEAHYLPRAKMEKRSWDTDRNRFAKLIMPDLGALPLGAVTRERIQSFVDRLAESGAAPSTVKQYLGIVSKAFTIAAETTREGLPLFSGSNPAKGVRLPQIRNARERFLTGKEADTLVRAAAHLKSPDLHDAIVLSLNTGLRLGELRRLTWLDVDFDAAMLTVSDEAGRKPGGKVPLNRAALAVLAGRRGQAKAAALVFPPIHGDKFRENLSHEFRRLVDDLGFNEGLKPNDRQRRVVFHSLRHTFASWLALAGVDIYRIKTLMRHKTLAMTMRYAHLIPDATRDAVHQLSPPTEYSSASGG